MELETEEVIDIESEECDVYKRELTLNGGYSKDRVMCINDIIFITAKN